MTDTTVYLDYNSTTPLEPEVLEVIQTSLRDAWGNPSSSHSAGIKAKKVIESARRSVAGMVNGQPSDIIFTSGGTEANNLVLSTAVQYFWENNSEDETRTNGLETGIRPHFITSNLEHDSIKLVLEAYCSQGKADVSFVPACKLSGRVESADVVAAVRPTTCMVSVMLANNETGIIQPVKEICERIRRLNQSSDQRVPRILLHTDAAQAIGKIQVNAQDLGVDFLTIVGHKFYGPRIGALYCSGLGSKTPLYPVLYGGGQERNYRPGTENTGMIAGLGQAAQMVAENLEKYRSHMEEVRDYLEQRLQKTFPGQVHFNGRIPGSDRIPNTCNVSILGPTFKGNELLSRLRHTQASVGAACHSSTECRASPVLLASGVPSETAINALRLSVGRHTTTEDIDRVMEDISQAVCSLENHS